jgi:hypothetical protein
MLSKGTAAAPASPGWQHSRAFSTWCVSKREIYRAASAKLARKIAPDNFFVININEIASNKKITAKQYFPLPNATGHRGKKVGNEWEKGEKLNYKSIKLLMI